MGDAGLNWRTFEQVTAYIYQTLGGKFGVKILGYGNDCRIKGKSQINHQIDILTSHSDGIHDYMTAIECKYWKDNVSKDTVMKLAEILEDAQIHKGVIVSRNGFTEDAVSFAKYKNIGLVELRETNENDPESSLRLEILKSSVLRPEIVKINFIPSIFNESKIEYKESHIEDYILTLNNGEVVSIGFYINNFKKEILNKSIGQMISKKYFLPYTKLKRKGSEDILYIDGFVLLGRLKELDGPKFHKYDEVWLIMKSLFENKSFTISKRGIINERK